MRIRWLFILLGTIQIHLSGSEFLVDKDGARMDTIASNLTVDNDLFGEWTFNGNESTSATEKVRRTRATTNDLAEQLKKNENELKNLLDESENANKFAQNASEAVAAANFTLNEATKKIIKEEDIKKAEKKLEQATKAWLNATEEERANNGTSDSIRENITIFQKEYERLHNKTMELKIKDEAKNTNVTTASEAVTTATTNVILEYDKVTDAEGSLATLEQELATKNTTYIVSLNQLAQNTKDIDLYEKYVEIYNQREGVNTKKVKLDEDLQEENNKLPALVTRFNAINTSTVLRNETFNKFGNLTVDKAIAEYTKKTDELNKEYLKSNQTNHTILADHSKAQADLNELKKIESFGFKETVQNLIAKYESLKKESNRSLEEANLKIGYLKGNISALETKYKDLGKALTNLTTLNFNKVSLNLGVAKGKRSGMQKNVNTSKAELDAKQEDIRLKKEEIGQLMIVSKTMNETLDEKNLVLKQAILEKEYSAGNFTNAEKEESDYKIQVLEVAKLEKTKIDNKKKKLGKNSSTAIKAKEDADIELKAIKKAKKEADDLVSEKNDAVKAAMELQRAADAAALKAFQAHRTKHGQVETLRVEFKKAKDDDEKKEAERKSAEEEKIKADARAEADRQKTVRALSTGLGITGGILVLMIIGGVIAFLLIRRKKNAKPKKPKREELDADNGLTIIRREGQPDKYVVKGEDFKIMGPLVRARVHNDALPLKHQLDGQEGGDKIEKLFFDKTLNQAYFIGEGVEIVEDDSVSVSENLDAGEYLTDEPCDKYQKEEDPAKLAPKSDGKKSAPSSEDKKDEKKVAPKSDEKKSSKSKRSNDPNPKKTTSSPRPVKK